jgi:hypothetical protein
MIVSVHRPYYFAWALVYSDCSSWVRFFAAVLVCDGSVELLGFDPGFVSLACYMLIVSLDAEGHR